MIKATRRRVRRRFSIVLRSFGPSAGEGVQYRRTWKRRSEMSGSQRGMRPISKRICVGEGQKRKRARGRAYSPAP